MPKCSFNESDDIWSDLYYNSKSQRPNTKYQRGNTYRHVPSKDKQRFNNECLVIEQNPDTSKYTQKNLGDYGLVLKPSPNDYPSDAKNFNSQEIVYSMNKKKRWLLPELLEKRISEIPIEPVSQNEYEAEQYVVTSIQLSKFIHQRNMAEVKSYHDNLGHHVTGLTNGRSFIEQINISEGRRTRWLRRRRVLNSERIRIRKNPNKRIKFKYGNRNRNSGVKRRNERFAQPTETPRIENNYSRVSYNFLLPDTIIKGNRGMHRNYKHFSVYKCSYDRIQIETERRRANRCLQNELNTFYKNTPTEDLQIEQFIDLCETDELKIELPKLDCFINPNTDCDFVIYNQLNMSRPVLKHVELIEPRRHVYIQNDEFKKSIEDTDTVQTTPTSINMHKKLIDLKLHVGKFEFNVNELQTKYEIEIVNSVPVKLIVDINGKMGEYFGSNKIQSYLILDYLNVNTGVLTAKLNLNCSLNAKDYDLIEASMNEFLIYNSQKAKSAVDVVDLIIELIQFELSKWILDSIIDDESKTIVQKHSGHLIGHISYTNEFELHETYAKHLKKSSQVSQTGMGNFVDFELTQKLCDICYDECEYPTGFMALDTCSHEACLNCWKYYIETKIDNMKVTASVALTDEKDAKLLTCIQDKCNCVLSLNMLKAIINVNTLEKYIKFYTDLKIIQSDAYIYCPNKSCNNLIVLESRLHRNKSMSHVCVCDCGYMVCGLCKKDAHFPAKCKQMAEYIDEIKLIQTISTDNDKSLYHSEGKNCPKCGNYMEKNGGCNHMSCICGFQFCWLCMKDFYGAHTAATGYACLKGSAEKDLIRYDPITFMTTKRLSLMKLKRQLYTIMGEQRNLRTSVPERHKLNSNISRFVDRISLDYSNTSASLAKTQFKNQNLQYNDDILTLVQTVSCQTDYGTIRKHFSDNCNEIKSNLEHLYFINEYLALLLNDKKSLRSTDNYSFRPNLYRTLKKSLFITERIYELFENGSGLGDYIKVKRVNQQIYGFIRNLKHLTIDYLNLYES